MKKLALKPGFALLLAEITFLCGLKPNAPDTELSGTEKRQLSNIYYKYFGSTEALSKELMNNELANKWPGNERKKTHECQRAILDTLHKLNAALIPAGPIDAATTELRPMELGFVMSFLEGAKANDIIILTLCTDVATEVPVVDESTAAKAKKWDDLDEAIGKFYPEEVEGQPEQSGDLIDIGETAARAFGYL